MNLMKVIINQLMSKPWTRLNILHLRPILLAHVFILVNTRPAQQKNVWSVSTSSSTLNRGIVENNLTPLTPFPSYWNTPKSYQAPVIFWEPTVWKPARLQNSPYFCVFKYARAVKQKRLARFARKTLTDFEEKKDCLQSKKLLIWLFGKFRFASRTYEVVLFSLLIG